MPDDEDDLPAETGQNLDESGAAGVTWFASCDSGSHVAWLGPNRSTRQAAQDDADTHNQTCDVAGAIVVS